MFGLYRYGLAFCVVISHLWAGMLGGPAAYAVWGFYCLSGFLMTLVLHEKYGFSPRGLARFALNRGLRIYPCYWAIGIGMAFLFYVFPAPSARFLEHLKMPTTLRSWLYSITLLIPTDGGEILHGSGALHRELWFYIAMALGLSRNLTITSIWFAISLFYTGWLLKTDTPFNERYTYIAACSLAFSLGALIYHLQPFLPVIKSPWAAVSAAAIWWLHVWFTQNIPGGPWIYGLYTSLAASAFAMLALMNLDASRIPRWLVSIDRGLGNLSYPIYLCHWGVGIAVTLIFPNLSRNDIAVFWIGFPLVNLVAYLLARFVEQPLTTWKYQARPSAVLPAQTRVHWPIRLFTGNPNHTRSGVRSCR